MSLSKPDAEDPGHRDEHPEEGDEVSPGPEPFEGSTTGCRDVIGGVHQSARHEENEATSGQPGKAGEDPGPPDAPLRTSN